MMWFLEYVRPKAACANENGGSNPCVGVCSALSHSLSFTGMGAVGAQALAPALNHMTNMTSLR